MVRMSRKFQSLKLGIWTDELLVTSVKQTILRSWWMGNEEIVDFIVSSIC